MDMNGWIGTIIRMQMSMNEGEEPKCTCIQKQNDVKGHKQRT